MCSKNVFYSYRRKSVISSPLNRSITKIFILALSLSVSILILGLIQNFSKANAQDSLGQTIQQFNNNLRSGIDKQIQSNLDQGTQHLTNDNSTNCNSNNNFVTQSQTTNNGQITTTKSDCNG